ncbi:cytochrome c maturation protein CcmE [Legionella spiritensis]|uniref:Cytochrome c-type biogenesis protein CcmE n=1 Tax=Legionella spiritensis TaxID=452 RepID=A0A0W0Z8Z9_LEGSP|nr:cytochrome c maturation protein CcmE [Legionella spiritensis]KTD65503.1 cytochrome c-type biogenesis protein CcmE [Legionella spiritensis]SNV35986.1 cytochrome c-type biogenesis protein CcmE [Legionella spiritensis]
MNPVRQRKIMVLIFMLSALAVVTALVMYALRQNISLFYTPTQLAAGEAAGQSLIRVGGMVVNGSIVRNSNDLSVRFQLTDFNKTIEVSYRGILPDLFREGQGIVALGTVTDNRHFTAREVLAKHDAEYMPPEVKDALAKSVKSGQKGG